MATLNLGRIKPIFKGAYASVAYVVDDIVTHGNETFICIQAHGAGTQATSQTAYWTKLAAKGADGTDVGTTLSTQGDLLYRDGSGLQRLAKGTASQELRMNSGATAPEWHTPVVATSDFVRLGQVNQTSMTGSIAVDFFTTDYDIFKVFVTGMNIASAGSGTVLRFNSSAGNAVSGSNYRYIFDGGMRNNSGSSSSDQRTHSWDDSSMSLSNGSPNDYEQSNHEITVYRPMNASEQTKCIITGGGYESNHIYSRHGQGVYNSAQAHTGITFLASTGNMSIEHIEVYGIK